MPSSISEIVRYTPLKERRRGTERRCDTDGGHLPMLVLLLALLMQGNLRQFYESATSTAENVDARAPPSVPVRREDREANERQPEAVLRASAQPAKCWSAKVDATMPAGGKNKGRKSSGLGPFFGATKEDAEAARNMALFDWMHAPTRAPKKQKVADMSASTSGSSQEQSAAQRPKRAASPSFSFTDARNSSTHVRTAGPGCAHPCPATLATATLSLPPSLLF